MNRRILALIAIAYVTGCSGDEDSKPFQNNYPLKERANPYENTDRKIEELSQRADGGDRDAAIQVADLLVGRFDAGRARLGFDNGGEVQSLTFFDDFEAEPKKEFIFRVATYLGEPAEGSPAEVLRDLIARTRQMPNRVGFWFLAYLRSELRKGNSPERLLGNSALDRVGVDTKLIVAATALLVVEAEILRSVEGVLLDRGIPGWQVVQFAKVICAENGGKTNAEFFAERESFLCLVSGAYDQARTASSTLEQLGGEHAKIGRLRILLLDFLESTESTPDPEAFSALLIYLREKGTEELELKSIGDSSTIKERLRIELQCGLNCRGITPLAGKILSGIQ